MDCTAIDFETANASRSSPCSVGVVVVKGGQVTSTFYSLIKPEGPFDPFNVSLHGITPEDVADKPEFPGIWDSLRPLLEGSIVIAHNASFDMSVLRRTLELYGLPFPEFAYTCSRIIAQKTWPSLLSFSLSVVAQHLGYEFDHHNALNDANASAHIAQEACKAMAVDTLLGIAEKCGIQHGQIMKTGCYFPASGACRSRSGSSRRIDPSTIVPNTDNFDEGHPFYGKVFAFTGTLSTMTRLEAMQCVVNVGGQAGNGVTTETDFLVLGEQDFRKYAEGQTKSSKLRKAETLKKNGQDIELISERDYLEFLGVGA
jgi:DNA polymerase-3 subunit epsilon